MEILNAVKKIDVFGESIPEFNMILGALAKLREVNIGFVVFVFLSVSSFQNNKSLPLEEFCKIARSEYWLRRVCISVCLFVPK